MVTQTTDSKDPVLETKVAEVAASLTAKDTCIGCNKIKHGDVIFSGKTTEGQAIFVHPECLGSGLNIKSVDKANVFVEAGKVISPARGIVIKKRLKAIHKAIAIANYKKQQEAGNAP